MAKSNPRIYNFFGKGIYMAQPDDRHVSDFKKEEKQIVLDLINFDNQSSLTLDTIEFGLPTISLQTGGQERNTDIKVTAVEGAGYVGSVVVSYNRLSLQDFVPLRVRNGILRLPVGNSLMFSDLIPAINAALRINLIPGSYIDDEIGEWFGEPDEEKEIIILMNPENPVFHGDLRLILVSEDIPLDSVITSNVLMGLILPEEEFAPDDLP